ncbi:MAG: hypothetical protein HC767_05080 [Akkermansiaceae bacterium]|nr:hypothetical protein [Akkermansiaceae bacterium]
MGFLDTIKRWRLAREGLSSGKKRRVHLENPIVLALEESGWIKFSLYAMFAVLCATLVVRSADGNLISDASIKSALCGFVIAIMAVLMFHVSFQDSCRRNSRVILVLGGLIGHLLIAQMMMKLGDAQLSRFLLVPFALAPMLHGVLLGRGVASFSAVFVTLIGCLLVPQADIISYMIFSFISGMTGVLLGYQVRRRLQLLQAGFYVGAVTLVIGLILGRLDIAACFGADSMEHLKILGMGSAAAFGTAIATVIIISGLLPVFEGAFHLTTDISWLELSDLNHKLLRQMQLEAPGTFHHSLIVAALAEAAAEKSVPMPRCVACVLIFTTWVNSKSRTTSSKTNMTVQKIHTII